jgi:hypothetical protein
MKNIHGNFGPVIYFHVPKEFKLLRNHILEFRNTYIMKG